MTALPYEVRAHLERLLKLDQRRVALLMENVRAVAAQPVRNGEAFMEAQQEADASVSDVHSLTRILAADNAVRGWRAGPNVIPITVGRPPSLAAVFPEARGL